MLFRATKWGWKALAARLMLAPLVAAGVAVPAFAQTTDTRPKFVPSTAGMTDTRPKFTSSPGGATDTRPKYVPSTVGMTDTRPKFVPGGVTPSQTPVLASEKSSTAKPLFASQKVSDPTELLRLGRDALKGGRFDEARALARQADANNTSGRWGLFGDTPESLENDIRSAKAKADKAQAEVLTKQAAEIYAKAAQARSEAEQLAMLDQAYALADRAVLLRGPTDVFDNLLSFGSTSPNDLKKEIDLGRISLRKKVGGSVIASRPFQPKNTPLSAGRTPTTPNEATTVASRTPAKPTPTPTKPAGFPEPEIPTPSTDVVQTGMKTPAEPIAVANPLKDQAARMVADARDLLKAGKLAEAKARASDVRKLNVVFLPNEDSPDALMRDILAAAKTRLDRHVADAEAKVNTKDFAGADKALTEAVELASSIGFLTRPLEEQRSAVRKAMGTVPKPTTPDTVVAAAPSKPIEVPMVPEVGGMTIPTLPKATDVAVAEPVKKPLPTGGVIGGQVVVANPVETKPAMMVPEVPKVDPKPMTPEIPDIAKVDPKPMTPEVVAVEPKLPMTPAKPALPQVADSTPFTHSTLPPVGTPTPADTGRTILADAANELRRGDLEMARKLAIQARNGGHGDAVKEDADALLREVDAEAFVRKQKDAAAAFKNAVESYNAKQYEQALGVLKILDKNLLSKDQQAKLDDLMTECTTEVAKLHAPPKPTVVEVPKTDTTVAQAGGQNETPTPSKPAGSGLADQVKALAEVEFQKFRSDGLDTESKAQAAFNRGETDLAIQMLTDFQGRVKGSELSASRQNLLLGPVERRLETFRIMKRQVDFYAKEASDKKYAKEQIVGRSAADIQKKEEIAKKVRQVNELVKSKDYRKAEEAALALKTLEPDDPTLAALYELAKRQRRVDEFQKLKDGKEAFFLNGLNSAEDPGKFLDIDNPVYVDKTRMMAALARGRGDDLHIKSLSRAEREIELKLDQPFTIEFQQTPIREVIQKLRTQSGINITTDDTAISDEQISLDVPVTESVKDLSLRNILAIVLDKARLKYVVENDVIRITTDKKAKGRLYTKVFSIMDLVTPVPDHPLPDHADINKVANRINNGNQTNQQMPWQSAAANGGLPGGTLIGGPNGANPAGVPGAPGIPGAPGTAGTGVLENVGPGRFHTPAGENPTRINASAQLMKLITGMVRPYSWQEMGGPGKVDYYDIGGALVVNQTADVIQEVQDLLEALRRLQDLSVAVEVRLISLSESFFERVGVDFAMNIKTDLSGRDGSFFERGLTTGQFRPEPFINDINVDGVTVGWNPAQGGFTPDLDIPIRPNSFPFGIPPFGGYPGPNPNGGLSMGLAFLNDVQVYMFLEAAQGDRRVQVMQAPKITLFNGQSSSVLVQDYFLFNTNLTVTNVGGQIIYIPQQQYIPSGISLFIQAVISADRRFVRMDLNPTLTELTDAIVPLFPITAFITPVFEGGSQGVPIPFTQFFQQPTFNQITVSTSVAVPDGGTVVLGGLKTLSEGRNEFGPPVLSSIPYLNRLFRNQGIGRQTKHLMIMVTPRIIINAEEELVQTGVAGGGPAGPPGSAVGTASD